MEITSMKQFLALDPEALKAGDAPEWITLFGSWGGFSHLTREEKKAADERKRLKLDPHFGIARSLSEREKAWATACYCGARAGEAQAFRLKAVQESIKGGHSAWHAASIAAGRVDKCACSNCVEDHKNMEVENIDKLRRRGLL